MFAVCGVSICAFNYGFQVSHSLIAVTFTYAIINLMYNTRYLVPVSFVFHMSYLLIGNYNFPFAPSIINAARLLIRNR